MGLLDVLNGMQNGPRGPGNPSAQSSGMSPMTMAILGLLAWKAVKHLTASQPGAAPAPAPHLPVARRAAAEALVEVLATSSEVIWAGCSPAAPRAA